MQPNRNYAKELDQILAALPKRQPSRLLLHACCAPCSSYVLEFLSPYFSIDLLYYNPNISPKEEFEKRRDELERLVKAMPLKGRVTLLSAKHEGEAFLEVAHGLEEEPEGGARCFKCYRLRLEAAARVAKARACDYFTTTLSISPLKNAAALNQIGEGVGEKWGVPYLPSDFKKKNGYKRSLELSKEYGLYRQDYCGCVYSKEESRRRKEAKQNASDS